MVCRFWSLVVHVEWNRLDKSAVAIHKAEYNTDTACVHML